MKEKPQRVYWQNSCVTISKTDDRGQTIGHSKKLENSSGKAVIVPDVALYIALGKVKVLDI